MDLSFLQNAVRVLDDENTGKEKEIESIHIDRIELDPLNPRKNFEEQNINELAQSILSVGQLQPISVRKNPEKEGFYIVNFGNSRLLAKKTLHNMYPNLSEHSEIYAVVEEVEPLAKLIENTHRADLDPLEIGEALAAYFDNNPSFTLDKVAKQIGKSKSWVSRHLSLIKVNNFVRKLIVNQKISNIEAALMLDSLHNKQPSHIEKTVDSFLSSSNDDAKITFAIVKNWNVNTKESTDEHSANSNKIQEVVATNKKAPSKDNARASVLSVDVASDNNTYIDTITNIYEKWMDFAVCGNEKYTLLLQNFEYEAPISFSFICNLAILDDFNELSKSFDLLNKKIKPSTVLKDLSFVETIIKQQNLL